MSPLLALLACGRVGDAPTELCADGWRRAVGECPATLPEQPGGDDSDNGGDSGSSCDIEVQSLIPGDGDEHYRRSPIRAELSRVPDDASIRVTGADGETDVEGRIVTWTPDEPLPWDTRFDAALQHDCGQVEWNFRTSKLGEPRTGEVVGRVYAFDPATGSVVVPVGVGAVLENYLEGIYVIEVLEQDGDTLKVRVAMGGADGEQDICNPTVDVDVEFADDPWLHLPEQRLEVGEFVLEEFEASGTFSADGDAIGGVRLSGIADTRSFVSLIGEDQEDDAVCNLMAGFGVECIACEDGTQRCLRLVLEDATAEAVTQDALVPIETCDESCSEEECAGCGCASGPTGFGLLGLVAMLFMRRRVPDSAA